MLKRKKNPKKINVQTVFLLVSHIICLNVLLLLVNFRIMLMRKVRVVHCFQKQQSLIRSTRFFLIEIR